MGFVFKFRAHACEQLLVPSFVCGGGDGVRLVNPKLSSVNFYRGECINVVSSDMFVQCQTFLENVCKLIDHRRCLFQPLETIINLRCSEEKVKSLSRERKPRRRRV
jgi:hypothetical protein